MQERKKGPGLAMFPLLGVLWLLQQQNCLAKEQCVESLTPFAGSYVGIPAMSTISLSTLFNTQRRELGSLSTYALFGFHQVMTRHVHSGNVHHQHFHPHSHHTTNGGSGVTQTTTTTTTHYATITKTGGFVQLFKGFPVRMEILADASGNPSIPAGTIVSSTPPPGLSWTSFGKPGFNIWEFANGTITEVLGIRYTNTSDSSSHYTFLNVTIFWDGFMSLNVIGWDTSPNTAITVASACPPGSLASPSASSSTSSSRSPSASHSASPSPSRSRSPSLSSSYSPSWSPTTTASISASPISSSTSPSSSSSVSSSPSPSSSPTATSSSSESSSPSSTPSISSSRSYSESPTASPLSGNSSPSSSPSSSSSLSPSTSPTATASPSASSSASSSPSGSTSPSSSPSISVSPSSSASSSSSTSTSASPTPSDSPGTPASASRSPSFSASPSLSLSSSLSRSESPSRTASPASAPTSPSRTASLSKSPSRAPTPSASPSKLGSPSRSASRTATPSASPAPSPNITCTNLGEDVDGFDPDTEVGQTFIPSVDSTITRFGAQIYWSYVTTKTAIASISIFADNLGRPAGAYLAAGSVTLSGGSNNYTISTNPLVLEAGQVYWVVLTRSANTPGNVKWPYTYSTAYQGSAVLGNSYVITFGLIANPYQYLIIV